MILTIDFGTSTTKVAVWGPEGLVTLARADLLTSRRKVGWAEQEPLSWWTSVVVGCAEVRLAAPSEFSQVEVVATSAARQTLVPVTASADALGRGIIWSDRRAIEEALALSAKLGGDEEVLRRTGVPIDAGSVAAKLAWLAHHEPDRLAKADWILSPRDLVLWRLTGEVATDETLASRTGLYDAALEPVEDLCGVAFGKLPPILPSRTVLGGLRSVPAAELGLKPGIPIVIGAGDRQCEVLGSGASTSRPMVSWGTTANVSVPVELRPASPPNGTVVSRGADGGFVIEGGLSAAGSFLAWLGSITRSTPDELATKAAGSPRGARGVFAVPWLDGARAPWWRDDAKAAIVGLGSAHDDADLARALVESVALDVRRCLDAVTAVTPDEDDPDPMNPRKPIGMPTGLALGGAGSGIPLWLEILTEITGLPAHRRRSGEAASAGAALLALRSTSADVDIDELDPVIEEIIPDPEGVAAYEALRPVAERVARAVLDIGLPA